MKKLFTLLALVIALVSVRSTANAQQAINFLYAGDSSWTSQCSSPDTVAFDVYGTAQGFNVSDSIHLQIDFGDGSDTSYYVHFSPGSVYFFDYFTHIYTLPGAYSAQFIATGPNGIADTAYDNAVLVATQCGDITGRIYVDANNDCQYNTGETPIQSYVYASYNGQMISGTYSDSLGNYYLTVPAGFTLTITVPNINNVNVTCPASGSYTVSALPASGRDFGISCSAQADLTANIWGQGFRANANTSVWLTAYNKLISCAAPNATVTVTLDPKLSYVSSSVTPLSTSATQVVFNAGQLNGLNFAQFGSVLTLLTSSTAVIGDTLCLTMTVDPVAGDFNANDNTVTVCMPVRNSCDPNEKEEVHAGAGSATVAPGTELEYTIMFQNVGNDVAFKVNVIDEIDPSLDLSTLRITGFSHPNSMYVLNNTLKFQFNNINLAAASVNETQSHGFISYKIKPKTNVALGTAINNTAKIYFDFNAPIVTNTVTDIVNSTVGLSTLENASALNLFPNPASTFFTVATGSTTPSILKIYDVTGRNLITQLEVADQQKVSTKNLTAGVYFVTLLSNGVLSTSKLVVN